MRLLRKPNLLQISHRLLSRRLLFHAGDFQRKAYIVQNVSLHEQIEVLEYHGDLSTHPSQLRLLQITEILPVDVDGSRGRTLQKVQAAHQRALSRSAHADDSVYLALSDRQIDMLQGFYRIVFSRKGLGYILYPNHFTHFRSFFLFAIFVVSYHTCTDMSNSSVCHRNPAPLFLRKERRGQITVARIRQ